MKNIFLIVFCFILFSNFSFAQENISNNNSNEKQLVLKDEKEKISKYLDENIVYKEIEYTKDYNCIRVNYYDEEKKFVGSYSGCVNSNPNDSFSYSPRQTIYNKDGKVVYEGNPL